MITLQQRKLCAAITEHAEAKYHEMDTRTAALIRALGSVIEGTDPIKAMGAPGDWGYGTPIGEALLELLQSQS